MSTETFNSLSGFYAGPISGTTDSSVWTASAPNGLFAVAGLLQTNNPETMTFSFGVGRGRRN